MNHFLLPSPTYLSKAEFAIMRGIALILVAIALGAGAVSAGSSDRVSEGRCDAGAECDLHLVADEERPFLWRGKVVGDPEADIPDKMRRLLEGPVRKFPTLASCMSNPEVIAQDLGQAKLKWSEFRSQHDAEVCLFRLFDRLDDTDMILAWLTEFGFIEPELRDDENLLWGRGLRERPLVEFAATWSVRDNGPLYGGFWGRLRQRGLASFTVHGVIEYTRGLIWIFIDETSTIQK